MASTAPPDLELGGAGAEEARPCPYGCSLSNLNQINADKDSDKLEKYGGATGLAKLLHADLHAGLDDSAGLSGVSEHRAVYGANTFPDKPPPSFLMMLFEAAKDPMIIILLVVALVSIVLGAAVPEQRAHNGWSEGVAVLGTALLVVFIGASQDYSKERQFQRLNALKDVIEVKVSRNGKQVLVGNTEIVVGDVMFLDTGDKLIADGIVIDAQGLVIDEASLTGESDPIKKDAVNDPWVRSGTTVNEGSGHMLVVAVGVNSEWGKTMALVAEAGDDQTPLQEQLTDVAAKVSKLGVLAAVICFLALLVKWLIIHKGGDVKKINDNGPVQFLLYAITITVVSIPEGLPLAVTLTLAYSMKKMMKDNNFVRVLSACETMGGATAICSDKTGTLTENRMTVVEGWFAGSVESSVPQPQQMSPMLLSLLKNNCALNSKAFLVDQENGSTDFVGNRTECALLVLLRKLGCDYKDVRTERENDQVKLYGFSSARKMASVLVREPSAGGLRLYNKGAAEWVLRRCESMLRPDGTTEPMDAAKLEEMIALVTGMAKRGLRCICLSYRDYPTDDPRYTPEFFEDADQVDNGLIAFAIVGIKDPVRAEVPDAVAVCQRAGIIVRMVTGDNIHTAQHIARECGILTDDAIAMEGPAFRVMPAAELIPLLPRLRVLARSSPEDKLTLVSLLKKQGEVVAVTGDGTNDAPALKESDVGLAMGIAGTEVAKEAADIIIMDDNFSSIVKAVLWGRTVYINIRKFLVFQLSINLVAMLSACVGALYGGVPPLNVLQLLWVNMIMDTLAALALATEDPYPELLDEKPHGRTEPIITGLMYMHIVAAAIYKLFWLFACLYGLPRLLSAYAVLGKDEYYRESYCPGVLADGGWNATSRDTLCNYMGYCGFPRGPLERQTPLCKLYDEWRVGNNSAVPNDQRAAVCRTFNSTVVDCPWNQELARAQARMDDEWDRDMLKSYKPALSVLFNAFILAQVANAFVSRRIGLELNFFKGLRKSYIFNSIMVIITSLQVIIMQTPISFVFKVQPLNGGEWGVCIAIGIGAIPFAWVVRLLIRAILPMTGSSNWLAGLRGSRASNITASGATAMRNAAHSRSLSHSRTLSGPHAGTPKSLSGRSASGPYRAPSGGKASATHVRTLSGNEPVAYGSQPVVYGTPSAAGQPLLATAVPPLEVVQGQPLRPASPGQLQVRMPSGSKVAPEPPSSPLRGTSAAAWGSAKM
ncbi:Calcium-transporting ATPase PAT1 [Tetrabaena socialis]|uniref:Calcium-transporting ATPase n=1 Tax=Tetrabaena socialis TaxID=47790 RepID=A0A2J8AK05_9CHLO|nr:Calcium-transporting ATPase PAT1 [Tetrabaena socialis]|eukprot:PNH12838.1 Calcium-transporting ATPase PAT1 [Tetrabaena socialis]